MKSNRKKLFAGIIYGVVLVAVVLYLALVGIPQMKEDSIAANWPGYSEEHYVYCHKTEREMLWEEDVIYLANTYLSNHPALLDSEVYIHRYTSLTEYDLDYSNELYDPELRADFIAAVEELIPRLKDLNDTQIIYEMQRIAALLEDDYSYIVMDENEYLPLNLDVIYENGEAHYYAMTVPSEHEAALFGRLTAINGVSIDEAVHRIMPYLSCSTREFADYLMVNFRSYRLLTVKGMLQAVGLMGLEDDSAELTFETEAGEITCLFEAVNLEEFENIQQTGILLQYTDTPAWRYWREQYAWYEVLNEGDAVYLRIWRCYDSASDFGKLLDRVTKSMRDAEEPVKLIIDLRDTNGGYDYTSQITNFINAVNRIDHDGVYVLIDGDTMATSYALAYRLARSIDGAQLVGSPAGHDADLYGELDSATLPNSGCSFNYSNEYFMMLPGDLREVDIEIYQTLEDYKNNVDTVLEAVLAME